MFYLSKLHWYYLYPYLKLERVLPKWALLILTRVMSVCKYLGSPFVAKLIDSRYRELNNLFFLKLHIGLIILFKSRELRFELRIKSLKLSVLPLYYSLLLLNI